ncbi:MAG: hypothetical protein C0473_01055 [Cyanobacteria bacterium DS3.002]|nr:hypothetical protein [Cyanobacteria bacterium DS3.002]
MKYIRNTEIASIIATSNASAWGLEPEQSVSFLQAVFEKANSIENKLRLSHERYISNKAKLADEQHWSTRRTQIHDRQFDVELEAVQLAFASNRIALQRMTAMFPVMKELVNAAVMVRAELVKAGDDEHKRRRAMNNLILAGQLQYRISRYSDIELMPDEATVQADPRGSERLTDVSYLAGLNALRSALEGTSGAVPFVDWKAMSWANVESEHRSSDYNRLEDTISLIEDFLESSLALFAEFEICESQQKESTYQKRIKAASQDQRKVWFLRQEQTRQRARLSSYKIALRDLPIEQIKSALLKVLMPFHGLKADTLDMAVINNVVRAQLIHTALCGIQRQISLHCSYEDDISYVGLLDTYSHEETSLRNNCWLFNQRG